MTDNALVRMSFDFAVAAVNLCDTIKGHGCLRDQMMRSATSIGANIREAQYAASKADFIAKLQISLKECYETEYWIDLFEHTGILNAESIKGMRHDCGAIRRMLIASLNTAKKG